MIRHILYTLLFVCITMPATQAASSGPGADLILRGNWEGKANVTEGKSKGKTWNWNLSFDEQGEPSGVVVNQVTEVKMSGKLPGPFTMNVIYSIGKTSYTYNALLKGAFSEDFQTYSGTFTNIMGSGDFSLKKAPISIPGAFSGSWVGTMKRGRGPLRKEKDFAVSLNVDSPGLTLANLPAIPLTVLAVDEVSRRLYFLGSYSEEDDIHRVLVTAVFNKAGDEVELALTGDLGSGSVDLQAAPMR